MGGGEGVNCSRPKKFCQFFGQQEKYGHSLFLKKFACGSFFFFNLTKTAIQQPRSGHLYCKVFRYTADSRVR